MKTGITIQHDGNFPERNLVSNQEQGAQEKLYIHIDFNTHVGTLLDEEEKNIWESDGSCEKGDELYVVTAVKKY